MRIPCVEKFARGLGPDYLYPSNWLVGHYRWFAKERRIEWAGALCVLYCSWIILIVGIYEFTDYNDPVHCCKLSTTTHLYKTSDCQNASSEIRQQAMYPSGNQIECKPPLVAYILLITGATLVGSMLFIYYPIRTDTKTTRAFTLSRLIVTPEAFLSLRLAYIYESILTPFWLVLSLVHLFVGLRLIIRTIVFLGWYYCYPLSDTDPFVPCEKSITWSDIARVVERLVPLLLAESALIIFWVILTAMFLIKYEWRKREHIDPHQ